MWVVRAVGGRRSTCEVSGSARLSVYFPGLTRFVFRVCVYYYYMDRDLFPLCLCFDCLLCLFSNYACPPRHMPVFFRSRAA